MSIKDSITNKVSFPHLFHDIIRPSTTHHRNNIDDTIMNITSSDRQEMPKTAAEWYATISNIVQKYPEDLKYAEQEQARQDQWARDQVRFLYQTLGTMYNPDLKDPSLFELAWNECYEIVSADKWASRPYQEALEREFPPYEAFANWLCRRYSVRTEKSPVPAKQSRISFLLSGSRYSIEYCKADELGSGDGLSAKCQMEFDCHSGTQHNSCERASRESQSHSPEEPTSDSAVPTDAAGWRDLVRGIHMNLNEDSQAYKGFLGDLWTNLGGMSRYDRTDPRYVSLYKRCHEDVVDPMRVGVSNPKFGSLEKVFPKLPEFKKWMCIVGPNGVEEDYPPPDVEQEIKVLTKGFSYKWVRKKMENEAEGASLAGGSAGTSDRQSLASEIVTVPDASVDITDRKSRSGSQEEEHIEGTQQDLKRSNKRRHPSVDWDQSLDHSHKRVLSTAGTAGTVEPAETTYTQEAIPPSA